MGSRCCKKKIKVINSIKKNTKKTTDFERPCGKITISYDTEFEVPIAEVDFKGFLKSYIRIWPKRKTNEDSSEKFHSKMH